MVPAGGRPWSLSWGSWEGISQFLEAPAVQWCNANMKRGGEDCSKTHTVPRHFPIHYNLCTPRDKTLCWKQNQEENGSIHTQQYTATGTTRHSKAWHAQATVPKLIAFRCFWWLKRWKGGREEGPIKADERLKGVTFKLHQHADTQHAY